MDDDRTVRSRVSGHPVRAVHVEVIAGPDRGATLTASAKDTVSVGTAEGNDLVLTDPTVSRYHMELRRHEDRISVVDLGSTNGTLVSSSVLLERSRGSIESGAVLDLGATRVRVSDGDVMLVTLGPDRVGELVGRDPAMRRLMGEIERVASSDAAVLILGESGTGKELIARAIHELGPRAAQPFVTVDCGAMPEGLFASELFGYERGAFTSADRKHTGAFERAHGGTLLLDEIGELPLTLQPTLLGALQRKRIRRVGGDTEIDVDVRIVAATNRDVRADVNRGAFRPDLYYRLGVVLLEVPPLRERMTDVPLLVEHFLQEAGIDDTPEAVLGAATLVDMQRHSWPGNVRELQNFVEAALATGSAPALSKAGAPARDGDVVAAVLDHAYRDARAAVLSDFEERYLRHLLERSGGSVRRGARDARMDRTYLMELLRRHGIR